MSAIDSATSPTPPLMRLDAMPCSSSSDQGKSGKKRSPETCRKISEMKALRAAERRALRPACLCYCGCGKALPERVGKHTIYLRGHQPQPDRSNPEFRAKLSEIQKRLRASGWEVPKESRMLAARKAQETKAERQAAGRIYTHHGSKGKLKGYKWTEDVIESRAAPMRDRPQVKPLTAKGPQNKASITGILRSPVNVTYRFVNMSHFVRTHEHLFLPEDVQWYGKGNRHCRALKGLLRLTGKTRPNGTWKGWTLVSFTETFYNRGESLLSGESSSLTNAQAMASADEKTPTKETTL